MISSTASTVVLLLIGQILLLIPQRVQSVPVVDPSFIADFDEEFLLSMEDADSPVDIQFSPDFSLMLVPEKAGKLWIVEDFDPVAGRVPRKTEALQITKICTNVERGFGGTAFHPRFGVDNRWIYLYYTFDKNNDCNTSGSAKRGPINRLSRFTLGENNIVDPSTEEVFFETPILPYGGHNSGQIRFGADGYLYVSVGDGGGGISKENDAGVIYPQALDMLLGKIIRLTDTGDIPPTNPYTDPQTSARCSRDGWSGNPSINCQEIYAYGLRNPFRFALDVNAARQEGKTRLFINDVGRHTWESVHEGGDGFAGANYGYPDREGPCRKKEASDCAPDSRYLSPIHWYLHNDEEGGAITGNAFYPNDAGWPWHFQNSYFYADYAFGGMYRVTRGNEGCPYPQCDPPISEYAPTTKVFSKLYKVTGMAFGPYMGGQALYVSTRGSDGLRGDKGIFRIKYSGPPVAPPPTVTPPLNNAVIGSTPAISSNIPETAATEIEIANTPEIATTQVNVVEDFTAPDDGDDWVLPPGGINFPGAGTTVNTDTIADSTSPGTTESTVVVTQQTNQQILSSPTASPIAFNRIPKAFISASTTLGFPPLFVRFDGTESYDPDGLDGPPLRFEWDLDGDGIVDATSPTPSFKYMKSGIFTAVLRVRDVKGAEGTTSIQITVENAPPRTRIIAPAEDATFSVGDEIKLRGSAFDVEGGLLPESSLTWEIRIHNADHWHSVLEPTVGNNLVLPSAPPPTDPATAKDSYLVVFLTATDDTGLSSTTKTILRPNLVDFALETNPPGLVVVVNDEDVQTPVTITTWANTEMNVQAKSQTDSNGNAYTWQQWSDGGTNSHTFLVAEETSLTPIVANFVAGSGDMAVLIDSPIDGSTFAVGDSITLSASATGPDGSELDLSGDMMVMMSWDVELRNETHSVSILDSTSGNHIVGRAPEPVDFEFSKTNYITITLTAVTMVDGAAAKAVSTVNIYPRKVDVSFDAIPTGMFLEIKGDMYQTPVSFTTWENHAFSVDAPSQRMKGESDDLVTYVWDSWSDDKEQTHKYVTPAHKHDAPMIADFRPLALGEEIPKIEYAINSNESGNDGSKMPIVAAVVAVGVVGIIGIVAFVAWTYKKPSTSSKKQQRAGESTPPRTPPISPTYADDSPYAYPS